MTSISKIFKGLLDVCKEYGPGVVGYIVVLLLVVVLFVEQEHRTTMLMEQQQETMGQILQQVIQAHEIEKEDDHKRKYQARIKASPQINNILTSYINRVGCDHIFLGEYHNGESNIATSIPFCKYSITTEYSKPGTGKSFLQNFTDENITKYNILPTLLNKHLVCYNIDELKDVDYYLYLQLFSLGVKNITICSMADFEGFPMGFIGCVNYDSDNNTNIQELLSCKDEIKQILIDINKSENNK